MNEPRCTMASVTDLATRRREDDVIETITFVFGGVNYGTVRTRTPYVKGKPVVLYLVPSGGEPHGAELRGSLAALITDDPSLAYDGEAVSAP